MLLSKLSNNIETGGHQIENSQLLKYFQAVLEILMNFVEMTFPAFYPKHTSQDSSLLALLALIDDCKSTINSGQ